MIIRKNVPSGHAVAAIPVLRFFAFQCVSSEGDPKP